MALVPTEAPKKKRGLPSWFGGVVGVVALLVVWQLAGMTVFHKSGTVPPPTRIVTQMHDDGWSFYWSNAKVTIHEAFIGYLWGNALAIFLAFLVLLVPVFERPLMRVGVALRWHHTRGWAVVRKPRRAGAPRRPGRRP